LKKFPDISLRHHFLAAGILMQAVIMRTCCNVYDKTTAWYPNEIGIVRFELNASPLKHVLVPMICQDPLYTTDSTINIRAAVT